MVVQGGKLFCSNCSEVLSSKKSIVGQHCGSLKHKRSKEEAKKSAKKVQTMAADTLKCMDASQQSFGQTLPMDMRVWRMQILTRFMSAGIPVAKIDQLQPLLKSNNYRLTDRSNLLS